jgi:hypothetical protein
MRGITGAFSWPIGNIRALEGQIIRKRICIEETLNWSTKLHLVRENVPNSDYYLSQ